MALARRRGMAAAVSLLLACCCRAAHAAGQERVSAAPAPLTGIPPCLAPIKEMKCIVDNRSRFVAGLEQSLGPGFGFKKVCSDGGPTTYLLTPSFQTSWLMDVPTGPSFPKLPSGSPDLRYLLPFGAPITQVIVLQAKNPFGQGFGTVPAVIFMYLSTDKATGETTLKTAICGNADYASFYLSPGRFRPPPTMVTLQAVFTNPASDAPPSRFLGSFGGKCSQLGRGYLGGDPNTSSKYHLLSLSKVCFAKPATFTPGPPPPPPPPPPKRVEGTFHCTDEDGDGADDASGQRCVSPCFWGKQAAQAGSPSASCVAAGSAVATGKYSLVAWDGTSGTAVEWWPVNADGSSGGSSSSSSGEPGGAQLQPVAFDGAEPFAGEEPEDALAA